MTTSARPLVPSAEHPPTMAPTTTTLPTPARPASRQAAGPQWPWYRREPWLLVMLVAFAPIALGFVLPQSTHVPLLAASALLVVMSIALLIRQGPFRARRAR